MAEQSDTGVAPHGNAEGKGDLAARGGLSFSELASRMGSGTVAVLGVLALPTVLGLWLDQFIGGFVGFTVGLIVGMLASCIVLIRLAQKWTPVARRSNRELLDNDGWPNDNPRDSSAESEKETDRYRSID